MLLEVPMFSIYKGFISYQLHIYKIGDTFYYRIILVKNSARSKTIFTWVVVILIVLTFAWRPLFWALSLLVISIGLLFVWTNTNSYFEFPMLEMTIGPILLVIILSVPNYFLSNKIYKKKEGIAV